MLNQFILGFTKSIFGWFQEIEGTELNKAKYCWNIMLYYHSFTKSIFGWFQEIDMNRVEQDKLLGSINSLKKEVDQLLRDPKTNTRFQMFPEFFPTREK